MPRRGLLLVNLGTPDSPKPSDVAPYLDEFLMDPRVLDIPKWKRSILVKWLIVPKRSKEAGEAYEKIWTDRGSPLLFHSVDLVEKVQALVGDHVKVGLAMRYQNPSIREALAEYRREGIDSIVVFPLFPQYSSAAWGSAAEEIFDIAKLEWDFPSFQFVPPFFDHPAFLDAFAEVARPVLDDLKPDRVVQSFHGLPERHVQKSDASPGQTHCLQKDDCCATIGSHNRNCYRAQCFATAHGIAERLELPSESWEITFQSRLGRDPWIKPYTDIRVQEIAKSGAKRIAVLCPAFVADCLETIEEIGMRAREEFVELGGEDLQLVPSLNSTDTWAAAVVEIARETASF